MEDKSSSSEDSVDHGENDVFINTAVKEPSENDVLCGRGGSINSHPGNERFRTLVEKRKRVYLTARFKREKRLIASSIVSEIRALKPPGRFLSRDPKSGLWKDIGDEKARDKTSQALRENAPSIRAEIETEINEQRAEMQREEDKVRTTAVPAPPNPYYSQWGYPPHYSYAHPPPPMPHGHYPPPPPHSHAPPPHHAYPPPPPHYDPYYPGYATAPDPYVQPSTQTSIQPGARSSMTPTNLTPKSAIEQTAEFVSSGAESIKNWTKNSFSFTGVSTSPSHDGSKSIGSKPISYKHEDLSKKRRIVKFRDDESHQQHRRTRVRPSYSPQNSHDFADEHDMEPQKLDTMVNTGVLTQVANHILGSLGSWDASTIVCGHDTADEVPFPRSSAVKSSDDHYYREDDETVEWEGQEVQLVDESKASAPENRNPTEFTKHDNNSSVAFSSIGSCHSWLPEQFGSAASYFSYNKRGDEVSGANSMEMDYSTGGTGEFSMGESLGGNSLTRVFEDEPLDGELPPLSPNMNHRILSRVPSWEANLRSKSPLSVGSDDESLMSKGSSKFDEEFLSPINTYAIAMRSMDEDDGLSWTRE